MPANDSTRCHYFAWEDELSTQTRQPAPPSKAPFGEATATPKCSCGESTIQRRATKEGPNKGRTFFKCAADFSQDGSGCGFFEFQDNPSPATQTIAMSTVSLYWTYAATFHFKGLTIFLKHSLQPL
ncbi:hypothetical protein NQZ79_g8590 [Umbelopsis isabellina]|nr:hypothetical protein NQZ79_g8590 [Umbelopsis isabellina]